MNSKGHLIISGCKSIIRIVGCGISIITKNITTLAVAMAIAEILGICEELVDKR